VSASSSTFRLDVVAAFSTGWEATAVDHFRSGLSTLVDRIAQSIRSAHPSVQLQTLCLASEQACALLTDWSETCAVALLDVTEGDESLSLFAGRLQGARVPCIVVCHTGSESEARRLGVHNSELITYTLIDELFVAGSLLEQELLRSVPQTRIHEELIYRLWFPRQTSTIWVVCPQIHQPGEFAERSSPDYTYLDNLGDTDALLEVMVFLSQYYPTATIEPFTADDLPDGHTSGNLVVIGGPGSADDISNEICKDMMRHVGSHVSYSADCEQMTVARGNGDTVQLRAEYRTRWQRRTRSLPAPIRSLLAALAFIISKVAAGTTEGQRGAAGHHLGLMQDEGYFARAINPLNENAIVVLINGIHTAGTLGAARAFGGRREALRNFDAVLASEAEPTRFECHFSVQVLNGHVKVPAVSPENILSIGCAEDVVAGKPIEVGRRGPAGGTRSSVTVLFIAGDRGGFQVNQLKIPNEYHAIQDALRASKHRDIISLGTPILAATRERLAQAYRQQPKIIHFAGHGDNRSLSIIEDHGLLASETPFDAQQFGEMVRTIEERVWLCVLNACESAALARQIVAAGTVDCAVGWPAQIPDSAAIAFSRALYGALGDGRSLADAVCVGAQACGATYNPVLVAADGAATQKPFVPVDGDER
jgi:hypothetical protein